MTMMRMSDGAELFVKDVGEGRPMVFVSSAAVGHELWQYQHAHFGEAGWRILAYDRRGHGRSSPGFEGVSIDRLADDLAEVLEQADVAEATLVGHSLGCGEIVRYLTRHGDARVSRAVLVAPITPFVLKTEDNPQGAPGELFQMLRQGWRRDFPAWARENARPFFAPGTSQALVDWGVELICRTSLDAALGCNHIVVETDFRGDCAAMKVPTLIIHGGRDASAPIELTGRRTAALIGPGRLIEYDDAPHGLMFTHMDRLHADMEAFLQ